MCRPSTWSLFSPPRRAGWTSFKEYRLQSRGGKGIINIKVTGKNGEAVGLKTVSDKDEIMLMTEKGMVVRSPVKDIRSTGRSTQGVHLMKLDAGDKVSVLAKIVPEDEDEKAEVAVSLASKAPVAAKYERTKERETSRSNEVNRTCCEFVSVTLVSTLERVDARVKQAMSKV